MSRYKLIIFDFDGTLGDTYSWFLSNINGAARLFGFREVKLEDIPRLREMETHEILRYLRVAKWKLPLIAPYMRLKMARELGGIKTFNGVENLIEELHGAGLKVTIVSSNSLSNVKAIIPRVDLIDHFECGSSLFGKKKKFLSVARKFALSPREVLCIGDEARDIEAAAAAGMDSGAVTWGYAGEEGLLRVKPTYLFRELEDILSTLRSSIQ